MRNRQSDAVTTTGFMDAIGELEGQILEEIFDKVSVIRGKESIKIYETREGTHRPADGAVPD